MVVSDANRPGERVRLADVARHAAVSPTTVSHVLSGKRLVNAATRDRVQDAIRELGYRPNQAARQLRTNLSRMVAVIVPDLTNSFYGVLTRGLADHIGGQEYGTYVCNTDGSADRERKFLHDVLDRGVDGIVMAAVNAAIEPDLAQARLATPIVCVGTPKDDLGVDWVSTDDRSGARDATAHLLERGRQRIAMIQGPPGTGTPRTEGYHDAMLRAGRAVDGRMLLQGDWTRAGGQAAMRTLLALDERPDAVFCANDLSAIGAIDVLRAAGLTVPDDIALVGFDDIDAATMVMPALTTVRNPAYEIGSNAGELLLGRMNGDFTGPARTVKLPCPLVERASV
ncbi:LacI family DNA-binding transcriptional regulator [Tenggerimyces flavus]|uniref:LacI family DNA-binding transcriptional regulator n=1 Tax=Tenggerimyces flavus TaxID=1708749 RepID=A0ABV7YEZ0_9ACTN|nr:LacI family DNA-binding transcriptional regulator [Tenggerimyces flavus]MBM7783424.1 LacI family transcriptional regulator [Tenggerimyces flavus]